MKKEIPSKLKQKCPERPSWLKGEGKKFWDEFAPKLHKNGCLTSMNRFSFAVLVCDSFGDFVAAEHQLNKSLTKDGERKLIIQTPNRRIIENPLIIMRRKFWDQFCKGCVLFGLTPADIFREKIKK